MRPGFIGTAIGVIAVAGCGGSESTGEVTESATSELRRASYAESSHSSGSIDSTNPFFASLGINGRSCGSCHDARAGWTMSSDLAQQLFRETDGLDPLFRPHDGANRPDADVSTVEARRTAYSMMLTRAVTRFTRTVPATAEYTVDAVDDPYGFSTPAAFSAFRRPGSVANIAKEVAITWTGTPGDMTVKLTGIMNGATKSHAQRPTDLPADVQLAGANFMFGLTFAQASDRDAGRLDEGGALGGVANLVSQPFYIGINALNGDVTTGAPFTADSFGLFTAWRRQHGHGHDRDCNDNGRKSARQQIAHGEEMFSQLEFDITDVPGLNDGLTQPVVRGTCTTCHNTPNIGGQSEYRLMNTGVAAGSRRTADMPLITVRHKTTGATLQTMDLGRATQTGLWADIGRFKAPTLRGVGSRAPYFHDGSAANLRQVLKFYKQRFGVNFRGDEEDLVAFLQAL